MKNKIINNIRVGAKFECEHHYSSDYYKPISKNKETLTLVSVEKCNLPFKLLVTAKSEKGDAYYTFVSAIDKNILCFLPTNETVGRFSRFARL